MTLARRCPGEVVMIDEVSRERNIPKSFLAKIFQSLSREGLVHSLRGTGGGFTLAKTPEQITLLEIIEAIEGPIALQRCLEDVPDCTQKDDCALCGILAQAQDSLRVTLGKATLADLVKRHNCMATERRGVLGDSITFKQPKRFTLEETVKV